MDANASLPIPLNEETLNIDLHRSVSPVVIVDAATRRLAESPARAKAASEQRRGTLQPESPPSVTRGAKSQGDVPSNLPGVGVFTSVDWFRGVCQESHTQSLVAWCSDKFGAGKPMRSAHFEGEGGFEFEAGVKLYTGHSSGICILEVPGSALAAFDGDERIELIRDLAFTFEMRATRFDIARDYVGQNARLFEQAHDACSKRQLVGARKGRVVADIDSGDGDGDSRTLYMGKRGKAGSGRMVRIYDKGKEQKIPGVEAGYWERWEAEFSKSTAHVAMLVTLGEWDELRRWREEKPDERMRVLAGNDIAAFINAAKEWTQRAAALALHAMDFREVKYRTTRDGETVRVRDIDRRPRVAWFQALVEGIASLKVKATRRFPSLTRWARWMEVAVIPTVKAMIERSKSGETIDSMLRRVIAGDVPAAEPGRRSVLWEYLRAVNDPEFWNLPQHWTPPKLRRA